MRFAIFLSFKHLSFMRFKNVFADDIWDRIVSKPEQLRKGQQRAKAWHCCRNDLANFLHLLIEFRLSLSEILKMLIIEAFDSFDSSFWAVCSHRNFWIWVSLRIPPLILLLLAQSFFSSASLSCKPSTAVRAISINFTHWVRSLWCTFLFSSSFTHWCSLNSNRW